MIKSIPTEKIVPLAVLFVLIAVGLVGWFVVRYPATSGYVSYDTDLPLDFDLSDAEQALVSQGYSVEADYAPEFYQDPYLRAAGSSRGGAVTSMYISVEHNNNVHIHASRVIYILPYEVVQDLNGLGREQQGLAEEDVREVLDVVGLPSTGTFTFTDDIDSLDYFIPTTVFYILMFVHLPLVIILAVFAVFYKRRQHIPYEQTEPWPRMRV